MRAPLRVALGAPGNGLQHLAHLHAHDWASCNGNVPSPLTRLGHARTRRDATPLSTRRHEQIRDNPCRYYYWTTQASSSRLCRRKPSRHVDGMQGSQDLQKPSDGSTMRLVVQPSNHA
eukprot:69777-Prorocentrum_minimum.AAC.3